MTKNTIFSFLQACEATVIKTAQKSWKGATIGALATFTLYLVIISLSYLKIGISPIADLSIALITVGILSSLLALLSTWGFKIIRLFNPWFVGICLSTYILVGFLPYPDTSRMFIRTALWCFNRILCLHRYQEESINHIDIDRIRAKHMRCLLLG